MHNISGFRRAEGAVSLFLEDYFYDRYIAMNDCASFERVYVKRTYENATGIRVIKTEQQRFVVYEKLHHDDIKNTYDHFVFGVMEHDKNSGDITIDVLVDDKRMVNYFLCQVIDSKCSLENRLCSEDLNTVRVIPVTKKNLKAVLEAQGIKIEQLKKKAYQLLKEREPRRLQLGSGIYLESRQYREKNSVELLLDMNVIKSLSKSCYLIKKNEIKRVVLQ